MIEPRGRAYLFRGVAGLIYSRCMDQLAYRINRTGVTTSSRTPWAVAQVNPVAKNALLTEGQRIIVPRHLTRMTTPSPVLSYAPGEH